MGADIDVGHREEGCRPPPVLQPHRVRVTFDPYDHDEVQDFWKKIWKEFSKTKDPGRWNYFSPSTNKPNVWLLDFRFRDIEDAMIFGLKYSR